MILGFSRNVSLIADNSRRSPQAPTALELDSNAKKSKIPVVSDRIVIAFLRKVGLHFTIAIAFFYLKFNVLSIFNRNYLWLVNSNDCVFHSNIFLARASMTSFDTIKDSPRAPSIFAMAEGTSKFGTGLLHRNS